MQLFLFSLSLIFLHFLYLLLLSPTSHTDSLSLLSVARSLFVFVVVCCVIGAAPHTNTRTPRPLCHSLPQPNCQKRFRFREIRWFALVRAHVRFRYVLLIFALFLVHVHTMVVVVLFSGIFFRSSRSIFSSGFFFFWFIFFCVWFFSLLGGFGFFEGFFWVLPGTDFWS